jgi:uncharacterized protein (DUF1330 family)
MDEAFTLVFLGYASERRDDAALYEDAVLPLLADHGAKVLFRGRRRASEDAELPYEVHVLWFPSRASYDTYLADDRRRALLDRFGGVFARKEAVGVDVIENAAHAP